MAETGYRFLPHTADAYIAATGRTFEEALGRAGEALFDTMCDLNAISQKLTEEIQLAGRDEITLLYNWLESLLLKFELEGKVYSRFEIGELQRSPDGFRGTARIFGERYDRRKHGAKVEVKAVTYHRMEVVQENSSMTVRFILDL